MCNFIAQVKQLKGTQITVSSHPYSALFILIQIGLIFWYRFSTHLSNELIIMLEKWVVYSGAQGSRRVSKKIFSLRNHRFKYVDHIELPMVKFLNWRKWIHALPNQSTLILLMLGSENDRNAILFERKSNLAIHRSLLSCLFLKCITWELTKK